MKTRFMLMMGMLIALAMVLTLMPTEESSAAPGDVAIDSTNFPDGNFLSYVNMFDINSDHILSESEINGVTTIRIGSSSIGSLEGVGYFKNLTELICGTNQLTSLDVSGNTNLIKLYCDNNGMTELILGENTNLTSLRCYNNALETLDVSKNTALTDLHCNGNLLKTLDTSKNTALTFLECYNNNLTSLNVSKNTALTELYCYNNNLTGLNVSKNTALTELYCYKNNLTSLNVSKNTALRDLYCYENDLISLDVSKNIALTNLDCYGNQLKTLDLSENRVLGTLNCHTNQLKILDVSANLALTSLYCGSNQLSSLDLSANTALRFLSCNDNSCFITPSARNTFNLSTLPGFDLSKANVSSFVGGTVTGNILTITADEITYDYDCGYSTPVNFKLIIMAATPPSVIVHDVKVTFDPSGGLVYPTSKTVTYGQKYGSLPIPEKDDCDFTGWYYQGKLINSSTDVDATKDHTLLATWSESSVSEDMGDDGGSKQYTPLIIVFAASALMFMMLLILAYIRRRKDEGE